MPSHVNCPAPHWLQLHVSSLGICSGVTELPRSPSSSDSVTESGMIFGGMMVADGALVVVSLWGPVLVVVVKTGVVCGGVVSWEVKFSLVRVCVLQSLERQQI